jgi:hypothetical protein
MINARDVCSRATKKHRGVWARARAVGPGAQRDDHNLSDSTFVPSHCCFWRDSASASVARGGALPGSPRTTPSAWSNTREYASLPYLPAKRTVQGLGFRV